MRHNPPNIARHKGAKPGVPTLIPERCKLCGLFDTELCTAFSQAGPAGMRALHNRHFEQDEVVFEEGDKAPFAGILRRGILRMEHLRHDGDRLLLGLILPGSLVGVLEGSELRYSVAAATDADLCVFDPAALERIKAGNTPLRRKLLQVAESQHARQLDMVWRRGALRSRDRIISFLVMAAGIMPTEPLPDGSLVVDIGISRRDWADWANATVETVCRTLTQLAEKELITPITPRRFRIHDLNALTRLAGMDPKPATRPSNDHGEHLQAASSGDLLRAINARPSQQVMIGPGRTKARVRADVTEGDS